jgi:hypothetical protein
LLLCPLLALRTFAAGDSTEEEAARQVRGLFDSIASWFMWLAGNSTEEEAGRQVRGIFAIIKQLLGFSGGESPVAMFLMRKPRVKCADGCWTGIQSLDSMVVQLTKEAWSGGGGQRIGERVTSRVNVKFKFETLFFPGLSQFRLLRFCGCKVSLRRAVAERMASTLDP